MPNSILLSAIVIVVYSSILAIIIKLNAYNSDKEIFLFKHISIMYAILILTTTLFDLGGEEKLNVNIIPFVSMAKKTSEGYVFSSDIFFTYLTFMVINIAFFIPLGFIISCIYPNRKYTIVFVFTFLLVILIELLQLALPIDRSFDIDDIIFSVIGALIGCIVYGVIKKGYNKRKYFKNNNYNEDL